MRSRLALVSMLVIAGSLAIGGEASAVTPRTAYVPHGAGFVANFSVPANTVGTPTSGVSSPRFVAITPDGGRAYVTQVLNQVTVIDTSNNTVSGSPITGTGRSTIAISPDGSKAYVGDGNSSNVSVINTSNNSLGTPINTGMGNTPDALAVSPDGTKLYVVNRSVLPPTVTRFDTTTGLAVGASLPIGTTVSTAPNWIAVAPDGSKAYVANLEPPGGGSVSVIDLANWSVLNAGISVGSPTNALAITPNGSEVYVAKNDGNVSVISTATDTVSGSPITAGLMSPDGVAISPDGNYVYISNSNSAAASPTFVSVIDTATKMALSPVNTGVFSNNPQSIAIVPDQGPTADFTDTPAQAGAATTFDGSSSTDPDGTVARYDWDFGDGHTLPNGGATPSHTYAAAGDYNVTLTVTDNEGCSTAFVFTGQTASCNSSGIAAKTSQVSISAAPVPPIPVTPTSPSTTPAAPGATGQRDAALKKCKKKKGAARKKCKKKAAKLPV